MKILVVCQYYHPEQFQINEIAPELVRRGHEVTVLTGTPNYPVGEIFEGYEGGARAREVVDGVRVLRTAIRPRKKGPVNLLRNYLSFAGEASKKARELDEHFDVVLCYQLSPVTMAEPAIAYADKNGVPLVLYCLDIWPESALAHVGSEKSPLYGAIRRVSRRCYLACDAVAVTSRPFVDYLHRVDGVPLDRLSYIPQHAAAEYLEQDLSAPDDGVADFMFAGNMGAGQTLDVVVRAVGEMGAREGFAVHMVGDGSERPRLEGLAGRLGVADRFVFHGARPRSEMPSLYRKADALLITLRGDNAVGDTMPGKLQTYMAAGKPVLGAINGAASDVIRESGCGACVPAGDHEGLARLMDGFVADPGAYAACGANARAYFESNFTLDLYCERIERLLADAVARGRR